MSRFPLWGLIFIALSALTIAKRNDGQNIEKVEIELDVVRGDAKITYNDEWRSKAQVLYAQKKKIVAYKDIENEWCLLEKIERRGLVSEEQYTRKFNIISKPLEKEQLEKLAGKKILTFCAKNAIIILKPYKRDDRREESRREGRVKREVDPLRGNESQISHQEASKKLLEGLTNAQGFISSLTSDGKGFKRNVDGKTDNSREHYPPSSVKVAHPPGIDYHTHIRNNIFPGTHVVHPIDITSSVTITTGSSHKIWSYSPSSGGYHNTTAISHPLVVTDLPQNSHRNISRNIPPHGVQHSFSLHHPDPSSLDQNQGHYSPSASSKSQNGPAIYPPSSTSKTQPPAHYQPSASSKPQHGPAIYPPSSTGKTQPPAHYQPSASSKHQHGPAIYPPSSTGKTQPPAHFPPSSVSKNHQSSTYYPPSATSKSQQAPQYLVPSSAGKTQAPTHYPPSAISKTQRPSEYFPPSSSTKAQYPSHSLPSAGTKYQPPFGHYPPSSSTKTQQGKSLYPISSSSKAPHDHEHHLPSSIGRSQHYTPSATDNTHHTGGYYPPSSASKSVHDQHPSTTTTHKVQQNITTVSQSGGGGQYSLIAPKVSSPAQYLPSGGQNLHHLAVSHHEQPSYIPPSSTSNIHYHPQNGTHFQHSTLYSYGAVHAMYAPQYPPSSTSKIYSPQQYPSSAVKPNYIPQSENRVIPHHKYTYSFPQYPPSSTTKFHTKLDQSAEQAPHYPPSSTTKMGFPLTIHDSTAPVLEKPSAEGSPHIPSSYATSSGGKKHPAIGDIPRYPPSSTSKVYYIPPNVHNHGTIHQGHTHPAFRSEPSTPPSGSPPSAQIPQPPVSAHFHSSLHMHSFPSQYYPPSGSVKQPHNIPHTQPQQPAAYYPSSTAKLHPVSKQNVTKHQPPGYFPPSSTSKLQPPSVGHRHGLHSGLLAPAHVPHYPPSAHSKTTLNQGAHSQTQHYPHYPPSARHHTRNETSIGLGKSSSPSSVGYTTYSQPHYYPPSGSGLHPNSSESVYPSVAMPSNPSGAQYYPTHSPYNVTISHHHQYHQPNIAPQPHDKPQFQQGVAKPCAGPTYSVTTRTIVTPNGVIQRPVSVRNNGESPCGNARQGATPHTIPCGSIIKNGQSVKVQSPCGSNRPNQPKSMRNILVPALIPGKKTEQNEYGSSDGVIITDMGESEAEVLDGIGYPVSHQQFSHLKENSTSGEIEDFGNEENETKSTEAREKEKVEEIKEEISKRREEEVEEEEEVKEGDVLEPGDRILGKNGFTISDGLRGRVVSVSGQIGKTRTTKPEKKSNSAQFKYSTELGRYFKDEGEKSFSDCHGEVTFTCTEFLGSNGRAKICKPNPRRKPDGSPC